MTTINMMLNAEISSLSKPGVKWGFLQTQRRDVCTALLAGSLSVSKPNDGRHEAATVNQAGFRMDSGGIETLQMRLRQIDDELDRIADNSR
jgi:hypothetical protein